MCGKHIVLRLTVAAARLVLFRRPSALPPAPVRLAAGRRSRNAPPPSPEPKPHGDYPKCGCRDGPHAVELVGWRSRRPSPADPLPATVQLRDRPRSANQTAGLHDLKWRGETRAALWHAPIPRDAAALATTADAWPCDAGPLLSAYR